MTFVELTRSFDSVSRAGLWKIMVKFGSPTVFIYMVRQFHYGMHVRFQNHGEYLEQPPVINRVKQDCVIAPTLSRMMFSAILTNVCQECDASTFYLFCPN